MAVGALILAVVKAQHLREENLSRNNNPAEPGWGWREKPREDMENTSKRKSSEK